MTADDARRIDDQIQEEMVAQQNADRDEAGELGDLLMLLLLFVLFVLGGASMGVAWHVTGYGRFGLALLLYLVGIGVGSVYLLREPRGGAR